MSPYWWSRLIFTIDFQSAYNYRNAIQGSVLTGYMPPWLPDTNYSNFRHERILSNQEINLINTWVGLGAPEEILI